VNPQLYYLHIPKSAGTSLSAVLTDHFAAASICPAQSWRELGTQAIQPYSLVRGHYGVPGLEQLPGADLVTVLRKPVLQITSMFEHMRRDLPPWIRLRPEDLTIDSDKPFSPKVARFLRNKQAQHLGVSPLVPDWRTQLLDSGSQVSFEDLLADAAESLSEEELLARAQATLDRAAIVGITSHLRELTDLLCYRYGWPAIPQIPFRNRGGERPVQRPGVDQLVQVDDELYKYAEQRFHADYAQMLKVLSERCGPVSPGPGSREVDALLDRHSEQKFEGSAPVASLQWTAGQPLWGGGWHDRERYTDGSLYRWTGPSSTSHLILPALKAGSMYVDLDIVACFRQPVESHLRLSVDGKAIQFFRKGMQSGQQTLAGYFRHESHPGPFCRWEFHFDTPVVPQSIDPGNADTRTVGVAISRISARS